jgi:hypothetical protein
MTEIQGAIGRYQLTQMPLWSQKRNDNQNAISECAKTLIELRVLHFKCSACPGCDSSSKCVHAAYKSYMFVENDSLNEGWDKDGIIDEVVKRGVPCFSGSCSEVYLEKAFDNSTKHCLRQLLYKKVPKHLLERPKFGFAVPLAEWLRGLLRSWADSLLDYNRLSEEVFFDAKKVNLIWIQHVNNIKNHEYQLWDILMFQAWDEKIINE